MKTNGTDKIILFLIQTVWYFKTVEVPGLSQAERDILLIFADEF